jgi:hypothetical protein
MISPSSTKIETLLSSSLRFTVPRYQREYAWKESEVEEFMEDVLSHSSNDSGNLFLGTLIFDVSDEKKNRLIVVDGQQRITTIIILLVACREVAKKLGEDALSMLIQQRIAYVDNATGKSVGFRLDASKSIKEVLDYISGSEWDGEFPEKIGKQSVRRQVNKIKPIYNYFVAKLKDFDQPTLSKFLSSVYSSYVVRIDIPNQMEAFSIFERTNARGVELEVSDLLKNFLFKSGVSGLEDRWEQIVQNSDHTLLRMLKYFYVSREGYVAKSDLYKKLKSHSDLTSPDSLVRELEDFSDFYLACRTAGSEDIHEYFVSIGCVGMDDKQYRSDPIYRALEGLRLFNVSQFYPLAYAAVRSFMRTVEGKKALADKLSHELIALFNVLENYHFINTAICGKMGNEVEKLYADFSQQFAISNDFSAVTKALIKILREGKAPFSEFASKFAELAYSLSDLPLIAYIFDRINNVGLKPGQLVTIFNPNKTYLRKNHNIEHFYPQNPNKNMTPDPEALRVVNNIGNLLAISLFVNTKLDNKSPAEKIEKLRGELKGNVQNMVYVQEFIETYGDQADSWGKDNIERRAVDIAKDAYHRVWTI